MVRVGNETSDNTKKGERFDLKVSGLFIDIRLS